MSCGASDCASKKALLSQFLDTDHRTRRLANDRVRVRRLPANQAVLRTDDQPLGRRAYDFGHIAILNISAISRRGPHVDYAISGRKRQLRVRTHRAALMERSEKSIANRSFLGDHIAQSCPWVCKRRAGIEACKSFTTMNGIVRIRIQIG